jgi:hypothetical protein
LNRLGGEQGALRYMNIEQTAHQLAGAQIRQIVPLREQDTDGFQAGAVLNPFGDTGWKQARMQAPAMLAC